MGERTVVFISVAPFPRGLTAAYKEGAYAKALTAIRTPLKT
jgi:hypothetical protein